MEEDDGRCEGIKSKVCIADCDVCWNDVCVCDSENRFLWIMDMMDMIVRILTWTIGFFFFFETHSVYNPKFIRKSTRRVDLWNGIGWFFFNFN